GWCRLRGREAGRRFLIRLGVLGRSLLLRFLRGMRAAFAAPRRLPLGGLAERCSLHGCDGRRDARTQGAPIAELSGRLNVMKEGLPRSMLRASSKTKGGPCNVVRRIGPQPQAS